MRYLDQLLTKPENYTNIYNAIITFSGVVLAIFFTLISLPVQNILGRYSQDFVKRITKSTTFIISFIILGIVFLYNLILLGFGFGSNAKFALSSIASGLASLFTLAVLVRHTFFQLDIRNQIADITSKIKKQIKPKILKQEKQNSRKFEVNNSIIEWLKNESEIIIDVTQKSIQENRFEIVDSGLSNLSELAREYLEARESYLTDRDAFLTYLDEKLFDMKNLVHKETHPKIMLSIANTAKDVAIESLRIRPIRAIFGENFIPIGFVNLLQNICLSEEILKQTSYAPMTACNHLVDIGKSAIDREFPTTADLIVEKLGEISRIATKLHFLYADYIANKANWGVAYLFNYSLSEIERIKIDRDIFLKSISKEINKSIRIYLEDDYTYIFRSNIKSFFGPLADSGIATIFSHALQKPYANERDYFYILEILQYFLTELKQNVILAMNRKKTFDVEEILDHIYMVGIALVGFIKRTKNSRQKEKALGILSNDIFYIFSNPISATFKKHEQNNIPFNKYLDSFYSLIGILFFENKDGEFSKIIEDWILKVIKILKENKNEIYIISEGQKLENYKVIHSLTKLYKYLRLSGLWFMKYLPENKILKDIIRELKIQPEETIQTDFNGYKKLYPESLISDEWFVKRPYLPFDSNYFTCLDKALYDYKAIENFEALLK